MARKALSRFTGLAVGLAVSAALFGGWGAAAHADECYSANCWIRIQEATDPAYQAAIHGGYYPYSYTYYGYPYGPSYGYPYGAYPYYPYSYYSYQSQYQYQYQFSTATNLTK